jgi:hypothetical protein
VKRKAPAVKADEGPRRRSGRLAGIEATAEEIQKREEAEEVEREIIRVVNRKIRDQVMDLDKMVEDSSPNTAEELVSDTSPSRWRWSWLSLNEIYTDEIQSLRIRT